MVIFSLIALIAQSLVKMGMKSASDGLSTHPILIYLPRTIYRTVTWSLVLVNLIWLLLRRKIFSVMKSSFMIIIGSLLNSKLLKVVVVMNVKRRKSLQMGIRRNKGNRSGIRCCGATTIEKTAICTHIPRSTWFSKQRGILEG